MIRLSVIMPARNEANCIAASLDRVAAGKPFELLVVDGQSEDATADIARGRGATVITSDIGRGRQLAAGIAAATGDVLLFLHADTLLPPDYREQVEAVLQQQSDAALGAFRLRIDAVGFAYRLVERAVQWRSTLLCLPYGDQAIFMPRGIAERVENLQDFDVMEDVELVRQARALGRIAITRGHVLTSARQWRQQGICRATLVNLACLLAYRVGASPQRIAQWRLRQNAGMAGRRGARTMVRNSPGFVDHDQREREG